MDVAAVADYLGVSPVFAALSAQERLALATRMRPRHYQRNEVVFHRDDPAAHVFLIATGTVKISVPEEGGQEVVVALARGGAIAPRHLSAKLARGGPASPQKHDAGALRTARAAFEGEFIAQALREHGGNVSRAARALGLSRAMLYKKLHDHGLI